MPTGAATPSTCSPPRERRSSAGIAPGTNGVVYGRAALASCSRAIQAALDGDVDAVVAAPQNQTSIAAADIAFDGHPTFVARETRMSPNDVFMMLWFGDIRIVHVTLHVSVTEALALITRDHVGRAIRATDTTLRRLGIAAPKIFVSGLNPHAGEGGLFGLEDLEIIAPAIAAARQTGIDVTGPIGCDNEAFPRKQGAGCLLGHAARPGPYCGQAAGPQSGRRVRNRQPGPVCIRGTRQRLRHRRQGRRQPGGADRGDRQDGGGYDFSRKGPFQGEVKPIPTASARRGSRP